MTIPDDQDAAKNLKENISSLLLKSNPLKANKIFFYIVLVSTCYTIFLLLIVAFAIANGSIDIFAKEGFDFLSGVRWVSSEGREDYGALPYIIGTMITSVIAMSIGVPISIGIAIFLTEIAPNKISTPISFIIELLAAVPSIIYGLWALFVFRIWIRDFVERPLYKSLGDFIPFFDKAPFGLDIFTAGIVLSIMIIPIVSSITRDVIRAVPSSQREAAYSLGATRWEMIRTAVFPYAKSGIIGASVLGLGRAIGETMLVTMIIGNAIGPSAIPKTLFSQGQTLSSLIANQFNEAGTELQLSALIGLGAILLVLTLGINIGARLLVFGKKNNQLIQ